MLSLGKKAQAILEYLVDHLPQVRAGDPGTYKTYTDVHNALGLPGTPHDLEHQGLAELANKIHATGFPAITGLIIRIGDRMPGEGYFKLYSRPPMDFEWWRDEIQKSVKFDWSPYVSPPPSVGVPPPVEPKTDTDAGPADRVEMRVDRILRDTKTALRVKLLHGYRCQICGETIELPDGRLYAEAHHVQPLGEPHNGPDIEQNLMCVCPNHHVELDYLARTIDPKSLRTVSGHGIDQRYIDDHNQRVEKAAST